MQQRKLTKLPNIGAATRFKDRAEHRALAKQVRQPWPFIPPKIYSITGCDQALLEWSHDGHFSLVHRMP